MQKSCNAPRCDDRMRFRTHCSATFTQHCPRHACGHTLCCNAARASRFPHSTRRRRVVVAA
eukprot:2538603-Lingulodinium_polyedra.AAC.1